MADPTPSTRLEAVNRMLASIGITRVSSIPLPDREDVNEAEAVLAETLRTVQAQGWEWNTDTDYELAPDGNGKIDVPLNAAQILVPYRKHGCRMITQRSDEDTMRLYDKTNQTFVFEKPVEATITWMFEFEDLPQAARWYITVRATREYATRMLAGAEAIANFTAQEEAIALNGLHEAEGEVGQYSMFDNYNSQFTLFRGGPPF